MKKMIFNPEKKDKILNIVSKKGFSYAYASRLLRNKDIRVDDNKIKENIIVEPENEITIFYDENLIKKLEYEIVFEDENILIVNKPTSIEIEGNDGLAKMCNAFAVHRLDRNTTGLVILAKTKSIQDELIDAFKNHKIVKKYYAEVVGKTSFSNYLFKAYLVKNSANSLVKIFKEEVKNSVEIQTIFSTIKSNPSSSIVECTLITGKTHQIRASLSFLGHPIIGDGKYGKNEINKKFKEKTQKLHCFYLKFEKLNNNLNYLNNKEFFCYPNWYKK